MLRTAAAPQIQMQQMQMQVASNDRRLSLDAEEGDMSDNDMDTENDAFGGMAASTSVADGGGGSSTFKIERATAIASDSKEHKVCVAMLELDPTFRFFLTPSIEAKAYTQARVTNTSAYTFLQGSASVFFDGSFICHTKLKEVMSGESFSIFLGTDSQLKVSHKLLKKSTKEGEASGILSKGKKSTQSFMYNTRLHNTKAEAVTITLVEILPKTEDDQIKVTLVTPAESNLAKSGKGADVSGEGQLAVGTVMKNRVSNNVVFSKRVEPGEKIDVPFSYAIEWPHGKEVEIY